MQDFDTLRERVEAMTDRLKSAQADRQGQTESLVAILRQLEEKHAAQSQQLVYYQKRVAPLEQANQQLTALMENLLDMIDSGFGEDSLSPLRQASDMAATMLESDLFLPEAEPPARDTDEDADLYPADDAVAEADDDPEAAALDEPQPMEAAHDGEPEMAALLQDEMEDDGEPDLEMEEDALISLDDLLDLASEEPRDDAVAFEDFSQEMEFAPRKEADGAVIDDGGFEAEFPAEDTDRPVAAFEDVSAATLAFEDEEDAAAGTDDLPEVVRDAMAAAADADDEAADLVPEIPRMKIGRDVIDTDAEDDLEAIAALAQQIEEETASEDSSPPAQSDIRALLLRVEALAKKAEAMRIAQGPDDHPRKEPGAEAERPQTQPGAAA